MGQISKNKCVIIGAGLYGQVYEKYLSEKYIVLGYFDDNKKLIGKQINDLPVIGKIKDLHTFIKKDLSISIFVVIGNNKVRVKLLKEYQKLNYKTPSFIHHTVELHDTVKIGKAVYILPKTNIMPLTTINDYVMISMGVNIAHHVEIKNGCFLSQGSNIGASMVIKPLVFIGIAATIMTNVRIIGENSIIGGGAVIIKNTPDNVTVVGNPGRIL